MERALLIRCLAAILLTHASLTHAANPYCVTGADWRPNGRMFKLGMPGALGDWNGSLGYFWGKFNEWNIPAMTNPCYRWTAFGRTPPFHCYDVDTNTINDPVATEQWVLDHPGKVYLLGNEPNNADLAAGDDMTPAEYARMYHTYYEFIKALDPTAQIAVAGLLALPDPGWVNNNINYWNSVLVEYQTQFGMDMPIDIWNNHCYELVGELDPDHIISDFFIPFRQYVNTVSGGMYADSEIWCTEFGVGMWASPLHPDYMAEFVQQLCPRLEASGAVDRFFWFLGPWEYTWRDSALLGQDGEPTVVGLAYSQLANSYPNPIPPPLAGPPLPVPLVTSDFEVDSSPWRPMGGDWAVDEGAYRQTRMDGPSGLRTHLPYWYEDLKIECDLKINAANEPANWVGVNLRGGTIWQDASTRGYLVFLRQNGELGLHNKTDGIVASVPGVVADMSVYHRLCVELVGSYFEISVDDSVVLTWDDPNNRRVAGLTSLAAGMTDCSFDNVEVATPSVQPAPGTLIFQDGRTYPDETAYAGTQDAHILQEHALYNTGGHDVLEAARHDGPDPTHDRSVVIKFTNLDTRLEAGKDLQQAVLTLYYMSSRNDPGGVAKTLYIHKLLHDWGEGTKTGLDGAWAGPGEVCWTKPFGATGGDNPNWNGTLDEQYADPTALDNVALSSQQYGPVSFDVTQAMQEHLATPTQNFGFVLREEQGTESTQDGTRQFHSREAVAIYKRPSLTLTFADAPPPVSIESVASLADHGVAGEIGLNVNLAASTLPADSALATTESREAGITKLVIDCDGDVTLPSPPEDLVESIVGVNNGDVTANVLSVTAVADVITISLNPLPDQDTYSVALSDSAIAGDNDFLVRALQGEVDNAGTSSQVVNALDLSDVRIHFEADVTVGDNAKYDIISDGSINALDLSECRLQFTHTAP